MFIVKIKVHIFTGLSKRVKRRNEHKYREMPERAANIIQERLKNKCEKIYTNL